MRALVLAALVSATPALAQSELNPAEIGTLFCAAIVAGDNAALAPLLTAELAELTQNRDVHWHSGDAAPARCMPVGATGSAEAPESVLFMSFPGGGTVSDRLILHFVDGQLRIDDVAFDRSGTLRDTLAPPTAGE